MLQPDAVLALASIDISTGEFEVGEVTGADLPGELARLSPGEVIVPDALLADAELRAWIGRVGASATPVPGAYFDSLAGETNLKKQLKVSELGGFGSFTRPELAAIGAALKYVELTQMGRAPVAAGAEALRLRRHSADRCREPGQPGAGALRLGREAGQPARRYRSHRHRRRARASWRRGWQARCAT